MTKIYTTERMLKAIEGQMQRNGKTLSQWSMGFAADPSYALSWGAQVYEAAAADHVLRTLREHIEWHSTAATIKRTDWTRDELVAFCADQVKRHNATSRSTSGASNLMEQYKLAAWLTAAGLGTGISVLSEVLSDVEFAAML